MPLLLHRSPWALAWRRRPPPTAPPAVHGALLGSSGAAPLHSHGRGRLAVAAAAVRHVFRDHSEGSGPAPTRTPSPSASGSRRLTSSPPHQPHPHGPQQPRRQHKAPDPAPAWSSLYADARLAHLAGLCYLPYDSLAASLEAEGLALVAYGRTSFTCWYVADGCIDFQALQRRAFPADTVRQQQEQQEQQQQEQQEQQQQQQQQQAQSASSADRSGSGSGPPRPIPPGASIQAPASRGPAHAQPSGPDPHRAPTDSSSRPDDGAPRGDHPSHGPPSSLRDGRLHLHHTDHPPLHLRLPHAHGHGHPHGHGHGDELGLELEAGAAGGGGGLRPGGRCRFIFLRGVQWSAAETNTLSLSASLAAFWPVPLLAPEAALDDAASGSGSGGAAWSPWGWPLAGDTTSTSSASAPSAPASPASTAPPSSSLTDALVAHGGVAALARELLPALLPYIRDAPAAGVEHVAFAGHSLGGSLAKLLWATSLLKGVRPPAATSCHTFGSPPVLAHAAGGGGARVMRLLRAPPASCVNYVLEHDPVPRAMLTADPYFAAARRAVPGLSALLALRGALLGEGTALSSGRFLFETVGELLLMRWSTRGGCEVVPVSEAGAEQLLELAAEADVSAPVRSLQYWLDHHAASYHHDLEAAALAAYRRLARQRLAAREAAAAAGPEAGADGGGEGDAGLAAPGSARWEVGAAANGPAAGAEAGAAGGTPVVSQANVAR